MAKSLAVAFLLSTAPLPLIASATLAQDAPVTEATRSKPMAQPIIETVPPPRDIAYPGTIRLEVDATDTVQRIYRVKETIPVASSGPMTLLFPAWLPGNHAPRGQIEKLAGLKITADGKPVAWRRDSLNVYAFHISVPEGAKNVVAQFQFLSATATNQGRVVVTPEMLNLQWEAVSLYPASYFTRQIPVQATVTYPDGWSAYTALRGKKTGATVAYDPTDYEVLVDSPVFAGKYATSVDLGHNVALNIVADHPEELVYTPDQMAKHRKLVDEAGALFGAYHFDHYDFLLSITDRMGSIGLEHHRSSENGVDPGYFTKWNDGPGERNLLPHEFTHSWDGKFRRSDLLWTPNFNVPMQDDLLWVYEGQTQFWGYVLGARSGLYTKEQTLDAYAQIAARYDSWKAREWRPMGDTTHDPIISSRRPKGWVSWQRSEDYYNEGLLIWLEADAIIRKQTGGAKGLDDFAKAFFGVNPGDFGELTYTRQDVIDTLNAITPYDWAGFLADRVDKTNEHAPLNGLGMGGYRLVFTETPSSASTSYEKGQKAVDATFGIGLLVKNEGGEVAGVIWDSPAFKAGLAVGMKIFSINGEIYSADLFRNAIKAKKPLQMVVRDGDAVRNMTVDYSGGLRYPHLEKIGEGEGSLDQLLKAKT